MGHHPVTSAPWSKHGSPWPKLPSGVGGGGPLLIRSCSLPKTLLVKCFGMRFFRHVYASVTTKIPAFCPACWCCRWFLPRYFCLVVLTPSCFGALGVPGLELYPTSMCAWHDWFFKSWIWLRCNGVVPSSCWVGDLPSGSCAWWVSWHRDGRGWSSAHTWVPPIWWNWSQTCDRAVLWWILWMVSCDKVFAWLGSFIDDNVYLGHRCPMCACLPLDSWCHLDRSLPLAWSRACSSLPHL